MQQDRLFTQFSRAKIGIRMLVDNRPALRAQQQQALFKLAEQVRLLLEGQVRYGDGVPAQCVIAPQPVGCVRDAAAVSELFRAERVGAVINIARAWAYPAEVMEYDTQLPQAVWGFSGSNYPGTVFMGAAVATAAQRGCPLFKIYGRDIQAGQDLRVPEDVADKLVRFAQCALALATLRGKTYLAVGSMCMGIGASAVDHAFFQCYLGMRTQMVDTAEILRRMEQKIYDPQEYARARRWAKENCREMQDPNPCALQQPAPQKQVAWDDSVKLALILRDLMQGNPALARQGHPEEAQGCLALAASFQGQRHWTDWQVSSDFAEAVLNSSFDWDGPRRPVTVATENDALQAAAMLMGTLLTGTAQIFCDMRAYWSPQAVQAHFGTVPPTAEKGFLYLTNSGPAPLDGTLAAGATKPFWAMTAEDMEGCIQHTQWGADKRAVFAGGGFSTSYQAAGGVPMTMVGLSLVKGLGPVLQIIEGETIALQPDLADALTQCTDPTWMRLFFVPRLTQAGVCSSVYNIVESWASNHCTLCGGHRAKAFTTLASMLRIPVCLHNLPPRQLFRPAVWGLYGEPGSTEADFRACQNYGPLYGAY